MAKEPRFVVPYNERLRFHLESDLCQSKASDYALDFNLENVMAGPKQNTMCRVDFIGTSVYRVPIASEAGGYKYLAVEEMLEGEYLKFNDNAGKKREDGSLACDVAQAFSHFTFEKSEGQEMVVDIQGVCLLKGGHLKLTDPQLHSKKGLYGRADCKCPGIKNFFKTHQCNEVCKKLGLTENPKI